VTVSEKLGNKQCNQATREALTNSEL